MIKLDIRDYCHCCPNFRETVTETKRLVAYEFVEGVPHEKTISDFTIKCANAEQCQCIKQYLEGYMNE